MSLLVTRYLLDDRVNWGIVVGTPPSSHDDLVEIRRLNIDAQSTAELIETIESKKAAAQQSSTIKISANQMLSPITGDSTIICQGLNYSDHAAEAQHHARKQNLFFAKASSSITGAFGAIKRPDEVHLLDYEVEFGIVLRRGIDRKITVTTAELGSYVAGVVLANDVSARDVMFGASFLQWFQGKSYRTFCPLGPVLCLMEREEVAEVLANLEIKLWVNGELRQSATSSQLIFGPAETITHVSGVLDLKKGDVILTGTPGGVTAAATPKLIEILKTHLLADSVRREELTAEMVKGRPFLKPGDVIKATLRDVSTGRALGGMENAVVADES